MEHGVMGAWLQTPKAEWEKSRRSHAFGGSEFTPIRIFIPQAVGPTRYPALCR